MIYEDSVHVSHFVSEWFKKLTNNLLDLPAVAAPRSMG